MNDLPKLTLDSETKNFLCFYLGDYIGNFPNHQNNYLDLINELRADIKKAERIYWQMELDEFNQEKLNDEAHQRVIKKHFGHGVLIYPFIKENDLELPVLFELTKSVFRKRRFNIMFPEQELERAYEILRIKYLDIANHTCTL